MSDTPEYDGIYKRKNTDYNKESKYSNTSAREYDSWSMAFISALYLGFSKNETEHYIEVLSSRLSEGSLTVVAKIFRSQGSARISFEFALQDLRSVFQPNDPEIVASICLGTMIESWPRNELLKGADEDLDLVVRVPPRVS